MYINKSKKAGFVLGIAMIVVAVLLTLSIAISIIFLRDMRESNISYDTRVAATLADSSALCAESIFKNFKRVDNTASLFPPITSMTDVLFGNFPPGFPYVNPNTVGCFDVPIFPTGITLSTGGNATGTTILATQYQATATLSTSDVSGYSGGAKYFVQIKRTDFSRFACAEIEMHTTSTGAVLIIGRGKVPCDSTSRVERVVVKRYN